MSSFLEPNKGVRPLRRAAATASAALVVAVVVLTAVAAGAGVGNSRQIMVTNTGCAKGWNAPRSGAVAFDVTNRTPTTVDVQLLGTGSSRVYAEIFTLAAGTTRPLSATLEPGLYHWQCASVDQALWTSVSRRVSGTAVANPTPWYIPVGPDDLDAAVLTYRNSVTIGLVSLVGDTDRLKALVDRGDLEAAKAQWLVAHLDYERLGAAYDTFGPFDTEIDGRPNGLPGGVHDPQFTGFLRVEYELWHNSSPAAVEPSVAQLDADVRGLQAAFPHQIMLNTDLPLRAHEILENALQFELTGETDQGSNTNLATVSANIQGTQATVAALEPILGPRDPQLLTSVTAGLASLQELVDRYRMPDGWWVPVQSLDTSEREQLDGAVSSLLEQLSIIPGSLRLFSVGAD